MGVCDSVPDESELCSSSNLYYFKKKLVKITKMKAAILACVLLGLSASAYAEDFEVTEDVSPRFLGVGFNTSSTATSLPLLGALILLGVIGYLVYVGGLLGTSSYNRNDYYDPAAYDPAYAQAYQQQAQYRSEESSSPFTAENILKAISMVQEIYEASQS